MVRFAGNPYCPIMGMFGVHQKKKRLYKFFIHRSCVTQKIILFRDFSVLGAIKVHKRGSKKRQKQYFCLMNCFYLTQTSTHSAVILVEREIVYLAHYIDYSFLH